mgnify:CR=1 FL=1
MSPLMQQLEATAGFIQSKITTKANTAIILGSGLGNLSSVIEADFSIPYNEIPNFPVSTVEGHKGRLILGTLNGKKVWVMEGRFHFYEGYTAEQVVFPIRVLKLLGVENLLLSNAAGGVNKDYEVGDLMIIKDHISFFTPNPLLGKNESALGTRFPDMSEPYANTFIEKAKQIQHSNPNIKFLVQTDVTQFLNAFIKQFPDAIYFSEMPTIHESDESVHKIISIDKRKDAAMTYLSAIINVSKCKYLITHTGNCSLFTVLFRGNKTNVYQNFTKSIYNVPINEIDRTWTWV